MATPLTAVIEASTVPAPVPFLLSKPPINPGFLAAMQAAAVAESACCEPLHNTRRRVCYFLCEVANQLHQRGALDLASAMPLSRYEISDWLDISLCKVKRVLALLELSRVISTDGRTLQVLDWQRLCAVAHVDPARLSLSLVNEDDDFLGESGDLEELNPVTISGEPACFV